ncbi:MAG: histidine phosphatase family protein [Brevibacterium sp.]|uniref:histidine phosphatase family protein n=1 Tax=Brevibacterium sp. TaxID=1701 RepID=UPI0026474DD1|nr:histidine phosphatase family protein [Brevibacterium sp.]MDN5805622.1 histidine phosphatase family protein [Brevibacterium sp.]MDN5832329.1 histidine phosphatase family protein [Brevibacterium sp.]MDN5876642.1 histidine phosphatase family protein [Brevibacterium sp.]MDN5908990.1 histidine phosphatase family protein [Brevibacterium sp.]MDN6123026.1 histidine phosphatase family protein [Brevibacterium sp.]
MPVIVLLRHGVSTANTAGILAGRAPGVSLTDYGVTALRETLRMLPQRHFSRLLHSPLMRCVETAQIAAATVDVDSVDAAENLIELDYGEWTGRPLKELGSEELWKTVIDQASQARFPGGEAIAEASDRAVSCVRSVVSELRTEEQRAHEQPGQDDGEPTASRWAMLVSHGDIIKAIIADALAMPLDDFQRISVAPGSFTVIDFSGSRPVLTAMSITAAGLSEGSAPGGGGLR